MAKKQNRPDFLTDIGTTPQYIVHVANGDSTMLLEYRFTSKLNNPGQTLLITLKLEKISTGEKAIMHGPVSIPISATEYNSIQYTGRQALDSDHRIEITSNIDNSVDVTGTKYG